MGRVIGLPQGFSSSVATPRLVLPSGSGTAIGATLTLATPLSSVMPIFCAVDGERSTIRPFTYGPRSSDCNHRALSGRNVGYARRGAERKGLTRSVVAGGVHFAAVRHFSARELVRIERREAGACAARQVRGVIPLRPQLSGAAPRPAAQRLPRRQPAVCTRQHPRPRPAIPLQEDSNGTKSPCRKAY